MLGHKDDPGVDILSIIRKHQLPESFPDEVMAAGGERPGFDHRRGNRQAGAAGSARQKYRHHRRRRRQRPRRCRQRGAPG
ncbi:hypothetical protein VQ056_07605 [Paenibacillus sp. JTLBN-2024]